MSFPRLPVLRSACVLLASQAAGKPLNLVLITADDMNWDSAGCNGCMIPGITPNIDRLAAEGILFREAHKWREWGQSGISKAGEVCARQSRCGWGAREKGWV
jgi:hypothetical protein